MIRARRTIAQPPPGKQNDFSNHALSSLFQTCATIVLFGNVGPN